MCFECRELHCRTMDKVKALAKELGLIETFIVSQVSSATKSGVGLFHKGKSQTFDYVIVIDFESTCWDSKNQQSNWQRLPEVIEFPAVLLNLKTGDIEDQFHHYVMPIENPILSEFCVNLTGIVQEKVNAGAPLGTCIMLFNQWINKITMEKKITFHKPSLGYKACTFVTWSDWDLTLCLDNETRRKQIRKPDILSKWIDLRHCYKEFYQRKPQGLKGALAELGLSFSGREHSGIIDAKNTARLAHQMTKDGCQLSITSCSKESPPQANSRRYPVGALRGAGTSSRQSITPKRAPLLRNKTQKSHAPSCSSTKESVNNTTKDQLGNVRGVKKISPVPSNAVMTGDASTPKRQNINLSSCKRTPPLCRCGRRAVCKVANSPGPNQGRCFFTCPNQRRSLGMVTRTCSFFMWC